MDDLEKLDLYPYSGHSALMGKSRREWQDVEYVLGFFGKRLSAARKKYRLHVEKGVSIGRRPELVGGGLIRSLGGWDEVKKMRISGQDRIKSDQRILGDSDFVNDVFSESEENLSREYRLKSQGYDFEKVAEKVSILFKFEKDYITGKGRPQARVRARDLGIPMVDIAKRLDMTIAAISIAVKRGETIAKENGYKLKN